MATQQVNERLAALTAAGTSVWLDQIGRQLIESGELRRLVEEDSLRGVTSNPTIFNQAILGAPDYDDQLGQLAARGQDDARDLPGARDPGHPGRLRRPAPGLRRDGRLRRLRLLEVDPDLAFDTEKTMEQAREYWSRVDRPNLMIKIPGTDEGVPGDRGDDLRGAEHQRHAPVLGRGVRARRRGLHPRPRAPPRGGQERRHAVGRVVLRLARGLRGRQAPRGGRPHRAARAAPGLANARAAYRRFKAIFHGERFAELREAGASVQRPLWASTGVKNPKYPDTMYVDGLVGPETVNTMPMATLLAAADHAKIEGDTVEIDPEPDLRALAEAGIDLDEVTAKLLADGVDEVRRADGQAARGHRREARGDRHLAPADDPGRHPRRPRAADRRARRARRWSRTSAHRDLEEGRHALGPGRAGRGRQPARLADDRRHDARGRRRPRGVRAPRSATRASRTSCCSAWAARRSRPR